MNVKGALSGVSKAITGLFTKSTLSPVDSRGWYTIFDSFRGAWQSNVEINLDSVLAQSTVFSCITLIANDIGKLRISLKEMNSSKVWEEVNNPSFSPVLRKPNHYQTRQQFIEQWVTSKLTHGNTYVLKVRDNRNVVKALYVLDANLVKPLVAENGDVFYQLSDDKLSLVPVELQAVPASEIIHDRMNCLFHPLVGLSPIFACGLAATQGLKIQQNSAKFFENMSRPSGILSAPAKISDETAKRLKDYWEKNFTGDNIGKVAVLGDSLKYEAMSVNPVDAQLVEQLKMSAEQVCSTFHVPAYMVGVGEPPAYNNIESLTQAYYGQCLQALTEAIEATLDEGLGLPYVTGKTIGVEFELEDLFKMDSATQIKMLTEAVKGCIMKPNEARLKRNLMPVDGGDTIYMQQQYYSLEALSKRDSDDPFLQDDTVNDSVNNSNASSSDSNDNQNSDDIEEMTLALIESIKKGLQNA